MSLSSRTVAKWLARERYEARRNKGRSGKLDPHKATIRAWLEKHPDSAQQIFRRLVEGGDYHGGYTIVKEYVRKVRPRPPKAYLSLSFAPGESAQVDRGHCGTVAVGNTKRNLSVFVMVLSYSRQMYIEFTLSLKSRSTSPAVTRTPSNTLAGCLSPSWSTISSQPYSSTNEVKHRAGIHATQPSHPIMASISWPAIHAVHRKRAACRTPLAT